MINFESLRTFFVNLIISLFAVSVVFVSFSNLAWASEADMLQRGEAMVRQLQAFSKSDSIEFRIPAGDYLIPAQGKRFHLLLTGMKRKKIIASGVRFIFLDPHKGGILIDEASEFTLEGGELDWKIKPFVVGTVDEVRGAGEGSTILVTPRPEFQASVKALEQAPGTWATLHDKTGKRKLTPWRDVIWLKLASAGRSDQIALRVTAEGMQGARFVTTGDVLVTVARHPDAHAVLIHRSRDVGIDGVMIRSSPGMGIVSTPGSSNLRIENSSIKGNGAGNWISTDSDGIHLVGSEGITIIRNNVIESTQDDAIVVSERGNWAFKRGDSLEFKNEGATDFSGLEDFLVFPEGSLISPLNKPRITKNAEITRIDLQGKLSDLMDGSKVPIFPVRAKESSVLIEGNLVNNIRGIGIRVCRPGVIVRGNSVSLTVEQAIAAGPWLFPVWLPQMPAVDVRIEGNTISQPNLDAKIRDLRGTIEVGCRPLTWCAGRNPNGKVSIRDNKFEGGTGYARERIFVQ